MVLSVDVRTVVPVACYVLDQLGGSRCSLDITQFQDYNIIVYSTNGMYGCVLHHGMRVWAHNAQK